MSEPEHLPGWAALAGTPGALPARLSCERAVLGKTAGSPADFGWIAASPAFTGLVSNLARHLGLGNEDVFRDSVLLWRADGGHYHAVRGYPARAPDAHGRRFLEKQVLEWEAGGLPAALGALVLLPLVAGLDDAVWRDREELKDGGGWESVSLEGTDLPAPTLALADLTATIAAGVAELRRSFREDDLGGLYARLLAGERGVFPTEPIPPLSPAALAALLLPLPRELADRLSLIGWLPSTFADHDQLRRQWDLVLGSDAGQPPPGPPPGDAERARGLAMAQAIYQNDPEGLPKAPPPPVVNEAPQERRPTQITLWGPSGSGKTVFLGQLYWQVASAIDGDWDIFPGEHGLEYLEAMRDAMYSRNDFPLPTTLGAIHRLVCHLLHRRTAEQVTLALEDRAGKDFELMDDEVMQLLRDADGIVLLLDPIRQDDQVTKEVARTLDRLIQASGRAGKESRPVAVCLTKADMLIELPADWCRMRDDPSGFARRYLEQKNQLLLGYLGNRLERFELFPASAAGVRLRHGAIEPVAFLDETLRPRINSGEAFNLLAPIDWLIGQLRP